jgi:hypothetical protein
MEKAAEFSEYAGYINRLRESGPISRPEVGKVSITQSPTAGLLSRPAKGKQQETLTDKMRRLIDDVTSSEETKTQLAKASTDSKEEVTDVSPRAEAAEVKETTGKQQPLAIRNNNPGNLRFADQKGASKGENGFARFETPEAGLTAMRRQIVLDTQERGLTLDTFINKYAPPVENETTKYLKTVSKALGIKTTDRVPMSSVGDLQKIMIRLEGGQESVNFFLGTEEKEK